MESRIKKEIVALKLKASLAEVLLIDKVLDIVNEEIKDVEFKSKQVEWEQKRFDYTIQEIVSLIRRQGDERFSIGVKQTFEHAGQKFAEQNPRPKKE